ncbi:hypothetical protein KZ294_28170, partial [Escherichia coli]|nr:hypothetical protein [Escherichia coli]
KAQVVTKEQVNEISEQLQKKLQTAYDKVPPKAEKRHQIMEMPKAVFNGIPTLDTSVPKEELLEINRELVTYPEDFK